MIDVEITITHRRRPPRELQAGLHDLRPHLPGSGPGPALPPALGDRDRLLRAEVDHPRRPGPARPHPRRDRPGGLRPAGHLPGTAHRDRRRRHRPPDVDPDRASFTIALNTARAQLTATRSHPRAGPATRPDRIDRPESSPPCSPTDATDQPPRRQTRDLQLHRQDQPRPHQRSQLPLHHRQHHRTGRALTIRHQPWRASQIPDTGPNKVRPGTEDDLCENGAGSSHLSSRTRP